MSVPRRAAGSGPPSSTPSRSATRLSSKHAGNPSSAISTPTGRHTPMYPTLVSSVLDLQVSDNVLAPPRASESACPSPAPGTQRTSRRQVRDFHPMTEPYSLPLQDWCGAPPSSRTGLFHRLKAAAAGYGAGSRDSQHTDGRCEWCRAEPAVPTAGITKSLAPARRPRLRPLRWLT